MPTHKAQTEHHVVNRPKVETSGNIEDNEKEVPVIVQAPEAALESDYAAMLNWLNQDVEVTLNSSTDRNDTTRRVVITINKRSYAFMRGQPKVVPRFVLEHIASAKRENIEFHGGKNAVGDATNTSQSVPYLKHPHSYRSLVSSQSDRIKEAEWYQTCLNRHY